MSRKCKTVSFDLNDEYEKELLSHAERGSFSKYIKELIRGDIRGRQPMLASPITNTYNQSESISEEVKQDMSSFF